MPSSARIASLDGLRACAVATVVICHLVQRFPHGLSWLPPIDGVQIFFILSGFLITTLLLREQEESGTIGVRAFYIRRILRILPAFYIYLLLCVVFCFSVGQAAPWKQLLSASLFLTNFFPDSGSPFTVHTWSLAVEEQFYLVWPLLLILSLRRGGRRTAMKATLILIALSPLIRVGLALVPFPSLSHRQAFLLPTRMDSLFCGCFVALALGGRRFEATYERMRRVWWLAPLFLIAISPVLRLAVGNAYTFTLGYTLESAAGAYFVLWTTRNSGTLFGRVLNWKPVVLVGLASYSMYLYQMPLIEAGTGMRWNSEPIRVLAAIFVAAFASFYFVERPFAGLRSRFARRSEQEALAEAARVSALIREKTGNQPA